MSDTKIEYKGYVLWRDRMYCHWHIRHDGKGSVPDVLDSSYTHLDLAKQAVDRYRHEVPLEAPVEATRGRPKLS